MASKYTYIEIRSADHHLPVKRYFKHIGQVLTVLHLEL